MINGHEIKDFTINLKKLNGRDMGTFDAPCRVSTIDSRPSEQDIINRVVEMGYNPLLYTWTVS